MDDVCRCPKCTDERPPETRTPGRGEFAGPGGSPPLLHSRSVTGLCWYAAGLGLALVASHLEGGAGLGTITGLLVAAYGYDVCRRQARLERRAAGLRW